MSNGPPPGYDSKALLAALLERPRPSKVVEFPSDQAKGTPFEQIRLVVPRASAKQDAQLAAHRRMQSLKLPIEEWKTETGAAMLGDFCSKECLVRMIHGVEEHANGIYARVFGDSKDLENALSPDEIDVLFTLAMQVENELGPRLHVFTDADVELWVEALKDGFDFLAYLQSPDLVRLVRGLHRLVLTERAKSTGSSPPDSLLSSSRDGMGSTCETSVTHTGSSGEQQDEPSVTLDTEPMSSEAVLRMAQEMARKSKRRV